ncbi:MAG: CAP domain-containing protein [Burkholderiales bacterium]|nr:CAP domain-containing protein [Burkholderiales bacterium]
MRLLLSALLCATGVHAQTCQPSADEVVQAVNQVRAQPRTCGQRHQAVAAPVAWDERLAASASAYALELGQRGEISHQGQRAGTLRQRLQSAGYPMASGGEVLGGGPATLDQALALWLASEAHCESLMRPDYIHVGAACVATAGRYEQYWVLHLAVPVRSSPDRSP